MRLLYPSQEQCKQRLQPEDNKIKLVAVIDKDVVGYTDIQTFPFPRMYHVARILNMAVRDDMAGKGIGSALMRANVELADNYLQTIRFYLEVWADNEPAIKLYEKFGFEIEGRHVGFGTRDGKLADAYTMARIKKE